MCPVLPASYVPVHHSHRRPASTTRGSILDTETALLDKCCLIKLAAVVFQAFSAYANSAWLHHNQGKVTVQLVNAIKPHLPRLRYWVLPASLLRCRWRFYCRLGCQLGTCCCLPCYCLMPEGRRSICCISSS